MSFRAKENSCNSESALVRLHCPHKNCDKFYVNKKNLNEHFRLNPSHKPDSLVTTRVRITAKECAEKFLDDEKNPYSRNVRVKELCKLLTDEELQLYALPRITKIVTPVDYLLQETTGTLNDVHQKLVKLKNDLYSRYPEFNSLFCQGSPPETSPREKLAEIVQSNLPHSCDWIIELGNGTLFKDVIMPKVFQREYHAFEEFSCGMVGAFGIGQKDVQDTLRNKWGKKLETVIGINPI